MAPTSKLVAVLALAARLGGGTGADYEELAGAKSCDAPARAGDHVLSRYTTERPAGTFAFELPQFEWYHFIVGEGAENDGVLAALSRATEGACAGSKRRIAISAAALDAPPAPTFDLTADAGGGAAARVLNDATSRPKFAADDAADASGVDAALEIEIVHVTAASDYEIFQLIAAKNVSGALDLVNNAHAGVNARDVYGATPLMLAVSYKMSQLSASLLNAWGGPRVLVDAAKPTGHNALFYAVAKKPADASIVKALLKRGADPNAALLTPDAAGYTPLHFACRFGEVKTAELLLDFGADPMALSAGGETVLDAAKGQPYSVRKKLADILNEAVARGESEAAAAASAASGGGGGGAPAGEL